MFAVDNSIFSFNCENPSEEIIKQAKVALYGPVFWRNPTKFTFLTGDRDTISTAIHLPLRLWRRRLNDKFAHHYGKNKQ